MMSLIWSLKCSRDFWETERCWLSGIFEDFLLFFETEILEVTDVLDLAESLELFEIFLNGTLVVAGFEFFLGLLATVLDVPVGLNPATV